MDLYLKGCAAVLTGMILILTIGKERKDFALLLSTAASALVIFAALAYLKPILAFVQELESLGNLDPEVIGILMKCVGIGILTEISATLCKDSGNDSMGKSLQYLGSATVIWLIMPMFSMLIELIQRILGRI